MCLQKCKKSLQKKKHLKESVVNKQFACFSTCEGSGPYWILISLVDYKLAGLPKLCNGPPNFSRRGPEDPIIWKPGYISAFSPLNTYSFALSSLWIQGSEFGKNEYSCYGLNFLHSQRCNLTSGQKKTINAIIFTNDTWLCKKGVLSKRKSSSAKRFLLSRV